MNAPEPLNFSISTRQQDGVMVVEVAGELDLPVSPDLERALAAAEGSGRVLLDLSAVRFMDSSGLRTLLTASDRFARRGLRWAVVVEPESAVGRLLSISEVEKQLPLFGSATEARRAIGGGGE